MVAGGAVVKHVPGHQKNIDVFLLDPNDQPVQKGIDLRVPLAAIKRAADVPVGSVQNPHLSPFHTVLPVKPAVRSASYHGSRSLKAEKRAANYVDRKNGFSPTPDEAEEIDALYRFLQKMRGQATLDVDFSMLKVSFD